MFKLFHKSRNKDLPEFQLLFNHFRSMLERNNRVLEIFAELEDKTSGEYIFDINYLKKMGESLSQEVTDLITDLNEFSENKYLELYNNQQRIQIELNRAINQDRCKFEDRNVVSLTEIDRDCEEIFGGKNAKLGEIKSHGFRTPDGLAISVFALQELMQANSLYGKIKDIFQRHTKSPQSRNVLIEEIERCFEESIVPKSIEKECRRELKAIFKRNRKKIFYAVRSSAVGEDTYSKSHAGQYRSLLNVPYQEIFSAYKQVAASTFVTLSDADQLNHSSFEEYASMAVAVQEMVSPKASGIVYSNDPANPAHHCILISAIYGLGEPLVSGEMNGDVFKVSRLNLTEIIDRKIVEKKQMLVCKPDNGIEKINVPLDKRNEPCLTDSQVFQIAEMAFVLERIFKRPQDIEWALDDQNRIVILQCRPLVSRTGYQRRVKIDLESLKDYPILMKDQGIIANRGIAAGKVCKVTEDYDPEHFPFGGIAVVKYSSPKLSKIIQKSSAIITDIGGSTSHMATLTREFGVPAIVGAENALNILPDGLEVTIDAHENIVYQGIVKELLKYKMEYEDVYMDLPEYKTIRRMLKIVSPLHLIDPNSQNFTAQNCQTYHDIIRFCHEKAIQELINLNISSKRFPDISLREIKLTIPIDLKIIDIGNGIRQSSRGQNQLVIDDINSVPMKPLLQGLTAPNTWSTEPVDLKFGDFISSITRFTDSNDKMTYQGINLAVISDHYLNLSLRLGYHFNVVDAYISDTISDNYIFFRFVGGVTDNERRHRRALVIKSILEADDFVVVVKGDLVTAKVKNKTASELQKTLDKIGRLIGFTRQLDARMNSDRAISYYTGAFLKHSGGMVQ